jgi:hypothetical protein
MMAEPYDKNAPPGRSAARELHPEDRFTWEGIILRARLNGVIAGTGRPSKSDKASGRDTRGGVSGTAFKAVALVLASHADPDGSRIFPGDMTVAIEAETSQRTVKIIREKLLALGLLAPAGRYGHTPMYRLMLPDDLTELLVVLTPDEVKATAKAMRTKLRGAKAKWRNGSGPDDPDGRSSGLPNEAELGGPPDYPNEEAADSDGWSSGQPETANGWSSGQDMGGPPDTLNQPLTRTHKGTIPTPMAEVCTNLAAPGACCPEASISEVVEAAAPTLRLVGGNPDAPERDRQTRPLLPTSVEAPATDAGRQHRAGLGYCHPCADASKFVTAATPTGDLCVMHLAQRRGQAG